MTLLEQASALTEIIEELDQTPRVPISVLGTDSDLNPMMMTGNYSAIFPASDWESHPGKNLDMVWAYFKPGERWDGETRTMVPFSGFLASYGWQYDHGSNRIVSVRASDGYVHAIMPETLIYVSISGVTMARIIDDFQRILGVVKNGQQAMRDHEA